jgi:hypothetical protein
VSPSTVPLLSRLLAGLGDTVDDCMQLLPVLLGL